MGSVGPEFDSQRSHTNFHALAAAGGIVTHPHQPLCRLLVFDLRESVAEVVKSGGVERDHMLRSSSSLQDIQPTT